MLPSLYASAPPTASIKINAATHKNDECVAELEFGVRAGLWLADCCIAGASFAVGADAGCPGAEMDAGAPQCWQNFSPGLTAI
jgi:hypothetical protein